MTLKSFLNLKKYGQVNGILFTALLACVWEEGGVCVLTCVALIAIVITLIAVVVLMRQRDLSAWGIYERHSTLELHK